MYYAHGRWYDPNVGRFISPDEKGEYLYGSGEDAVNNVWMVVRGAGCQFADNELLGTVAFSDQLVKLLSDDNAQTWYGTECVNYAEDSLYQLGTHFGDAGSLMVSAYEVQVGGPMFVGGVVLAPPSGGTSLAPAAVGGALTLHGVGVGITVLGKNLSAVSNRLVTLMAGQGGKYKSIWQPEGGNWTQSEYLAKKKFGLSDRDFNKIIHDIKKRIPGNPDVWFNLDTGDVHDPRSGALIGNLLDRW